ncbi:MAG: fibronectin type III domain-containing protein [Terriglobales bacterium]
MKARFDLAAVLCTLALLAGCGTPGAPQPPSLELPRPPQDLTAIRKGNRVTLVWTPPAQTADGQNVRRSKLGPTLICRGVNSFPMAGCVEAVAHVPPTARPTLASEGGRPPRMEFISELPAFVQQQHPAGFAAYAVEVQNWLGRSAGLSNQLNLPLAPTLPPPADFRAEVTAGGAVLSWTGVPHPHDDPALGHIYRIYRQAEGQPSPMVAGEVTLHREPQAVFTDHGFEWEKTYRYWITVVSTVTKNDTRVAEVEGDDSAAITVFTHDVFPPAVPQGLEAVASGVGQRPFIDLTWTPNTDADLAGYNVYRQEAGAAEWTKMNLEGVTTPAFQDDKVQPGKTYTYSVTAVDLRGNESARSAVANETVR